MLVPGKYVLFVLQLYRVQPAYTRPYIDTGLLQGHFLKVHAAVRDSHLSRGYRVLDEEVKPLLLFGVHIGGGVKVLYFSRYLRIERRGIKSGKTRHSRLTFDEGIPEILGVVPYGSNGAYSRKDYSSFGHYLKWRVVFQPA